MAGPSATLPAQFSLLVPPGVSKIGRCLALYYAYHRRRRNRTIVLYAAPNYLLATLLHRALRVAMHDALAISQVVLWVVVVILAATVLALARQIGVLHERIAPMGALTIDKGPKIGDAAPVFERPDLGRRTITLGGPARMR